MLYNSPSALEVLYTLGPFEEYELLFDSNSIY